jgi:hypothetical protein
MIKLPRPSTNDTCRTDSGPGGDASLEYGASVSMMCLDALSSRGMYCGGWFCKWRVSPMSLPSSAMKLSLSSSQSRILDDDDMLVGWVGWMQQQRQQGQDKMTRMCVYCYCASSVVLTCVRVSGVLNCDRTINTKEDRHRKTDKQREGDSLHYNTAGASGSTARWWRNREFVILRVERAGSCL